VRSHAKASFAGSNSGKGVSHLPLLATLILCLCATACLLPGSALAGETRLPVETFGSDGTGASSFESPGALAFDQGNKHFYAYDVSPSKIYGFDASTPATHTPLGGNFPLAVAAGGSFAGLAGDPSSHRLYYAAAESFLTYAFDATGNEISGNFPLAGSLPCSPTVDPSGNVWIGEIFGGKVAEYDSSGNSIGSVSTAAQGFPCHVALDANANLYVSMFEGGVWKYTAASGYTAASKVDPLPREFSVNPIAVDRSSGDLYVAHPNHVSVYNDSGSFLYEFGSTVSGAEYTGIAIDQAAEEAYLADAAHGKVQVFGPALLLPTVTTEDADGVTTTAATLHGIVDPEGKQLTDCHFEWGATTAYGSSVPCVPAAASVPPDSTGHAVEAEISGLSPNTAYHFRVVAGTVEGASNGNDRVLTTAIGPPAIAEQKVEAIGTTDAILSAKVNPKGAKTTYHVEYGTTTSYGQSTTESSPIGFGGDDSNHHVSVHIGGLTPGTAYHFRFVATSLAGEAEGADLAFATYPSVPPPSGSCPNEQFRTGFGERLPDCRAYEQATPVDKHGSNVQGKRNAEQVSSNGDRVTFYLTGGLPTSGGSSTFSAYVASRGPGGWSSDGLLPLLEPTRLVEVVGWSDDLAMTFDQAQTDDGSDLYLRDGTGAYQVVAATPPGSGASLDGYAADTSHLVFDSSGALLPGAAAGQSNLYDLNHGALTLPGRIPVAPATSCDDENAPACVPAPEGAFAGNSGGFEGGSYNAHNAISRDGSEVYFTDRASRQIYVREDGTRTTQVSSSQKTDGTGPGGTDPLGPKDALLREVAPDGAQAFLTSHEELTNDANTGLGPAIARANIDGSGVNHTFLPLPASAKGVAVDGSHIYWVNTNAGTISRANLDGTGVEESFITGASNPQYVAVDGSHIYWTNAATGADGAGTIGRANLNGTGVEQSFITGASNPQGAAVDDSFVYWANAGSTEATKAIGRANLDGSSPSQSFVAVGGSSGPSGVAVNASFLYWTNPGAFSMGRATIAGASPEPNFVTGIHSPRGLALDGSYLYWGERLEISSGTFTSIGRVKLDGSERNTTFIPTNATQSVAVDDAHLYWAGGSSLDAGNDLYRYDSASGGLTDLSVDSSFANAKGADVQGFLGASPDGSRVYFVANGVLAPGAQPGGEKQDPETGNFLSTTNLYVSHAGTTTFVARMEGGSGNGDPENWVTAGYRTSRVADDGTLVFASRSLLDLSGHDHGNASACSGPCTEFYRYTPADEGLACITCTTTGTPPRNGVGLSSDAGYFLGTPPRMTIVPRNLSADGRRFFFETEDALLPADTNGVRDVYEWEARGSGSCESESQNGGCIYLISSGASPESSHFLDASASGDDAFFFTEQSLVPADGDELLDVYDASVRGGLAVQHQLTPPTCSSTACQANPAPPPDPSTASSSYRGAGNAHKAPSARRCPKGKRMVRSKGKVRCQKAAKQHKRHPNRGGSK
jgi:sugar lactone lactonase YvrE